VNLESPFKSRMGFNLMEIELSTNGNFPVNYFQGIIVGRHRFRLEEKFPRCRNTNFSIRAAPDVNCLEMP
jgi:hypothetical protein